MIHVIALSTPLYIAQCIELFCCFNTTRESTQVGENYAVNHKAVAYFDSKLLIFGE
jgi:hypothetical protein